MTSPYLGEVQIFGFNFAPHQWVLCNGTTLSITQNNSLFSLIGTTYGGNGTSNFQVPNLANRAPCSQGQGPALTNRVIGETFGVESVTLNPSEMPAHIHQARYFSGAGGAKGPSPGANASLTFGTTYEVYLPNPTPNTTLAPTAVTMTGGNTPHENRQPYLAVNFCMALVGTFPAFN